MILELSKSGVELVTKKFSTFCADGTLVDCGSISKDNFEIFLQLAEFLQTGNKGKSIKYKIAELSDKEVVALYSYDVKLTDMDVYFAGLLEIPCIARITDLECDYEKTLNSVAGDIKIRCDSRTENMMYYTRTQDNIYLNVSKNILNKCSNFALKKNMFEDLSNIFRRFDKTKATFQMLSILPIEDPMLYLYLVSGYGRSIADLLDLDFSIPDIEEYYNCNGKVAFDLNGQAMVFISGYGLVGVQNINSLDSMMFEGSTSEVFA